MAMSADSLQSAFNRRSKDLWTPGSAARQRRKLFDFAPVTHCSILGTCLTLGELRKAVVKIAGETVRHLSDHDVHTLGVRYAGTDGLPTKLLSKLLDEKYSAAIRKLARAADEQTVRDFWMNSREEGSIERSYWPVITHPLSSQPFFMEVFGVIHMQSHLVGASNRADIRALVQLAQERDQLKDEIARLQQQLREGWSKRDKEIDFLRRHLFDRASRDATQLSPTEEQATTVQSMLRNAEKKMQALERRCSALQIRAHEAIEKAKSVGVELQNVKLVNEFLTSEIHELEVTIGRPVTNLPDYSGQCVLYVGGVARGVQFARTAVEQTGAHFMHHDGGREQAIVLLRGLVGRASIVLVALDHVSHEAAELCKALCSKQGKRFAPMPRGGIGSILRTLREQFSG